MVDKKIVFAGIAGAFMGVAASKFFCCKKGGKGCPWSSGCSFKGKDQPQEPPKQAP